MTPQENTTAIPPSAIQSEISSQSKNVQSLNSRVNLANNLYIVFLVATLISTILIVRWNGKLNSAKDELAQTKDGELQKELKAKDGLIANANKAAGEANERAATLEKEAAELRKTVVEPRQITKEGREKAKAILDKGPKGEAIVSTVRDNSDAMFFAMFIRDLLESSGWKTSEGKTREPTTVFSGTTIRFWSPDSEPLPEPAKTLHDAIDVLGLQSGKFIWAGDFSLKDSPIEIIVGPKN